MSRRKTLALLGGGTIVAATAAFGYDITRSPTRAAAPWSAAGGYDDPRLRALSWAILAPNPHNRQPWIVDLSGPDEVTLHVDTNRLLPETDPFSRQIVIGLGCFLEVMRLAALEDDYRVETEVFPEGSLPDALDARPVARCRFFPTDAAADPLFAQVPHRRSNKEPYDTTRPVPPSALDAILAAAIHGAVPGGSLSEEDIAEARALSREALRIEIETEHTYRESVDLFRIGRREVDANPDGIDFTGPVFEGLSRVGLFTQETAMDRTSVAYRQGLEAVYANTDTAMGHVWLVTDGNTRADQMRAGRDLVRMNLAATAQGIAMQPLSQALQEYPEMAGLYRTIHARLAPDGGTVQMWARVGYGPEVGESPRWPLEAKLV
ncbi:twin-arginine translocation pathway signal protein [Rhodobacterales bacterium HKCCE4037]|nr:twin-arginine translocation pathway signal protein [Rhodobacterales bacterium HKCCE4037]